MLCVFSCYFFEVFELFIFFLIILSFFGLCRGSFRTTYINLLFCVELIIVGINILFLLTSISYNDILGSIVILFTLTVAASETSIALSLIILNFRLSNQIIPFY